MRDWRDTIREITIGLDNSHDQREFIKRLTQTIYWCRDVGLPSQPRQSLRSCKPDRDDLTAQRQQVFGVCLDRLGRLLAAGKRDLAPVTNLCGGRLLAYFPNDNLSDGFAETKSQGFFDANNIPPYDTWVWMVRNVQGFTYDDGARGEIEANYLVAWIPPDFIELASAGIAVNPEECIQWLETRDDEFVRSLRRMGFLV